MKKEILEFTSKKKWLLFATFLSLLLFDRILALIHFGVIYTDIDQMVMWNGAYDYSRGIFYEPYFYGQAYNYMLEAFLAVPFLWMGIPVYIALPVTTSLISLLPFIVLSLFFMNREYLFWAYLCLAFPLLLPLEYNFLTTISRGFVQAHFFVPFLFIPLFNPQSQRNVAFLYLAAGICFIMNQSSLLIILPISLFVYTYHLKSLSFYLKSLLLIPFFAIDYFAKYFYKMHPERVLLEMGGLKLDSQTFLASFKNVHLFENLFPFFSDFGIAYPFIFILLAIFCLIKSKKKEFLFIISILICLLVSVAIPKVQELVPKAGVFFTSSRLYLYLPVLLIVVLFLIFGKLKIKKIPVYCLLFLCGIMCVVKNLEIEKVAERSISETIFPVAKNEDLIRRTKELKNLAIKYNLDLIVNSTFAEWDYVFDSYAFNPLTEKYGDKNQKTISVNLDGDRRAWLYSNSKYCKQILLNGIKIDETKLKEFDYEIINAKQIIIKNNKLNVSDVFDKLGLKFGNTLL